MELRIILFKLIDHGFYLLISQIITRSPLRLFTISPPNPFPPQFRILLKKHQYACHHLR